MSDTENKTGTEQAAAYKKMKVKELKELLRLRDLPLAGKNVFLSR